MTTESRTAPGAEQTATPKSDLPLLALGVLCASTASPLIAAISAPPLAIAFWRNGLGALVVLPYAVLRHGGELRRLSRRTLLLALFAGLVLAAHFASYVPSLSYTTVASASALVCSQSVWAAVFSRILGERLPKAAWAGIGVALAGVLCVTGVDVSLDARSLFGDVLALLGGILGGAYIVTGSRVRRHLNTATYTSLCYGTSGLLLLGVCLVTGQQMVGFSTRDWVLIGALTLLAQVLGHSIFNHVLRSTSPTVVSLALLFTVPLATIIAALLVGEIPSPAAIPALALLVAGIGLVIWARDRSGRRSGPDADSNADGP